MATIQVKNNSEAKILFSIFKQGDAGIPYYADWINAGGEKDMKIGDFDRVGVGAQTQEGGRWVSDPRNGPAFKSGEVCDFTISKTVG